MKKFKSKSKTKKLKQWSVQRELVEVNDGWQRWDQLYQLLISPNINLIQAEPEPVSDYPNDKVREIDNASSLLCTSFHLPADPDPNY